MKSSSATQAIFQRFLNGHINTYGGEYNKTAHEGIDFINRILTQKRIFGHK